MKLCLEQSSTVTSKLAFPSTLPILPPPPFGDFNTGEAVMAGLENQGSGTDGVGEWDGDALHAVKRCRDARCAFTFLPFFPRRFSSRYRVANHP